MISRTHLWLRIDPSGRPPDGMRIVSVSSPMRVVVGWAVKDGSPGNRLNLEVEFAPPLPLSLWRNVTRFLTTPIF